jgi:hypothetical protein
METNVQTDKKSKKAKKFEAEAATTEVQANSEANGEQQADGEGKATGAPRPRKWDYGIIPEAQIVPQTETAAVKKEVAEAWALVDDSPTVEEYTKRGGDRHGLRVLSRRGLIKIIHADGNEFPKAYVAPVKEEAAEEPAQ